MRCDWSVHWFVRLLVGWREIGGERYERATHGMERARKQSSGLDGPSCTAQRHDSVAFAARLHCCSVDGTVRVQACTQGLPITRGALLPLVPALKCLGVMTRYASCYGLSEYGVAHIRSDARTHASAHAPQMLSAARAWPLVTGSLFAGLVKGTAD